MSDVTQQNPQGEQNMQGVNSAQGERLYRFHPDTGFTEVDPASAQVNQASMTAQMSQDPSPVTAQASQAQLGQIYGVGAQNVSAQQAYMAGQMPPPFAPVQPMQPMQSGQPVSTNAIPPFVTPHAHPYAHMFAPTAPLGAPVGAPVFAHQPVSPMGATAMGVPPTSLEAMHAAHMKQMQDYANAQAAYMAFMAQNGTLGASAQANQAQATQAQPDAQAQSFDFSQERMQEMYKTMTDVVNGTAEPTKILGLFQGISTDFWKGAALGAAVIALYNYTPLKDVIGTSLATLLAAAGIAPKVDNSDDGFDDDGFDDGFDDVPDSSGPQTTSENSAEK